MKYKYADFLFDEKKWQQMIEELKDKSQKNTSEPLQSALEDSIVTVEPTFHEDAKPDVNNNDQQVIPFSSLLDASNDLNDIDAKATNFAAIRQELESQLAELDALKSSQFEDISFNDLEPESYGMGRAA